MPKFKVHYVSNETLEITADSLDVVTEYARFFVEAANQSICLVAVIPLSRVAYIGRADQVKVV